MKRILLVEDDPDSSLVMSRLLRSTGYDVEAAHSIFSALGLAQAATFDLVLCDIGLPDGTGYELMEQLHTRYALSGVAMSGYGMDEVIGLVP